MCIRDRFCPSTLPGVSSAGTVCGSCLCAQDARAHRVLAAARWPSPVSYTHLTLPTICSV
eukprot:15110582-Alexandrium_andersonii.AAC.1